MKYVDRNFLLKLMLSLVAIESSPSASSSCKSERLLRRLIFSCATSSVKSACGDAKEMLFFATTLKCARDPPGQRFPDAMLFAFFVPAVVEEEEEHGFTVVKAFLLSFQLERIHPIDRLRFVFRSIGPRTRRHF